MTTFSTSFASHMHLAELPWFETRGGRIVLASPLDHPIFDVHTHLALAYLRRGKVDTWRSHDAVRHYLPLSRAIDLRIYANMNFSPSDRKEMTADLTWGNAGRAGMRETHTAANLLSEMDELGISRAMLLPIDFPRLSNNAETFIEAAERSSRLHSFASVHPYDQDMEAKLKSQRELGALGLKVHPAVQMVAPDNERAMVLYRMCAKLEMPVLWHCGPVGIEPRLGRHLCQVKNYWRPIVECPDTTFILGHSGALQFEMGLDLARQYENVYLDLACLGLESIRRAVKRAPPERVLFGSDWPFYHQAFPLAKVLLATEGDERARRRVLWENAACLFDLD